MISHTPYRLLLVEDNPGDAELAALHLAEVPGYQFEVIHASNLRQARTELEHNQLDAVILDLSLPDSTGLSTLQTLRKIRDDIDYVVVSGAVSDELYHEALKAGACDFIGKNDRPARWLVRSILYALERQRVLKQQQQLEKLVSANPDAAIVVDSRGVVQFVNVAALNLFGRSREDLIGELLGFSTKEGQVSEIEIMHNDKRRIAEMHVVDLEWNGKPACLAAIRDITEQRKLTEQLQQAQKMEALGRLAGGIAHDFNNILSAIGGNVRLARGDVPADHSVQESLIEIEHAVERATEIVRQILIFSRQKEAKREPIQIPEIAQEAVHFLRVTLPAHISITTSFEPRLPAIIGDSTQIHRILMNLGVNAAHAMRSSGGHLEMRGTSVSLDAEAARLAPNLQAGHYLLLEISDTGHGMDHETQQHIFEPFFTTKETGEGTGLGLSVVHGIIQEHGGAISVYSEPARGTTFKIYFPVAEAQRASAAPASAPQRNGQQEHILYVDDDKSLARLGIRMLQRLNYNVSSFFRPDEALRAFRENPDSFDAVIMDRSMPVIDGPELAREMLSIRPTLPIIMISGYVRPGDVELARQIGVRELLLKPDALKQLDSVLRDVLIGSDQMPGHSDRPSSP